MDGRRSLAGGLLAGLAACTPLLDLEGQPPTVVGAGLDASSDGAVDGGAPGRDAVGDGAAFVRDGVDLGRTERDSRVDEQPPQDSAPGAEGGDVSDAAPPPDDEAECVPGEDLGPCAECGPGGEPVSLEDDARCPLECPPDHRLAESGACERADTVVPRRCTDLGECDDDVARACGYDDYRVVAPRPLDACQRIAGCEGAEPPEVVTAPGADCNRFGRCDGGGACDVPAACAFPDAGLSLCGYGSEMDGTLACSFQLDPGLGPVQCEAFCRRNGAVCLLAALAFQRCDTSQPQECQDSLSPAVCVCGFP